MPEFCYCPAMHAGSPAPRQKARTPHKVRLRAAGVKSLARKYGLRTDQDWATFTGLADTTWSRLRRGLIDPGEEIIAAVLGSHPEDPEITFDLVFEVVPA